MPDPDREPILAPTKVKLGILLAGKEGDQAALERGVALLREGLSAMLRESEGVHFKRGRRASKFKAESEALAWMREYIPRFDTAAEGKYAAIVAELYYNWTNMHLSVKNDRSDAVPWRDWDEAPRVGRKAVAIQMAAGIADKATQENLLARYEINLGRILYQESEYTDATQVLSDAFARLNNKTGWDHLWERCGFLRGLTMLISGRAAEAEAHFRECIEVIPFCSTKIAL